MQNCKNEFIIDKVRLYTIFPLVMRLTSLKTVFCVQPTSSKFLMLKSILYATHVSLNMFEIFSLLQSNNNCMYRFNPRSVRRRVYIASVVGAFRVSNGLYRCLVMSQFLILFQGLTSSFDIKDR